MSYLLFMESQSGIRLTTKGKSRRAADTFITMYFEYLNDYEVYAVEI